MSASGGVTQCPRHVRMLDAVDRFAVIEEQVSQRGPRHSHIVLVKKREQAIDNRTRRGKGIAIVREVIDKLAVFA